MAKITIPTINLDDEITSTDINTFINSVNALPNNLNEDNVREQGIDRRNVAQNCATLTGTSDLYRYRSDDDHAIPTNTTGVGTMTDGVSVYPIGVGAGASGLITLADGEKMIVWASFEYHVKYNVANTQDRDAGDGAYELWFQLGSRNSGGATPYVGIGSTLRISNIVLADRRNASGLLRGRHFLPKASLTISTVIENTTGGNQTYGVALLGQARRSITNVITVEAYVKKVQMFCKVVRR